MSMTTTSPSNSRPSTSRALISKFTSSFTSKARTFSDFHIQNDEPHRHYSPGDFVRGTVFLTVHRPLQITHIVVCLYGYVKVYRNGSLSGDNVYKEGAYLGTGRGKRGTEYFGNGFASIFEDELILCGDGRLLPGKYAFKYELEFPSQGLPSSIDFERGTVSYMITSTMTRPVTIAPVTTCDRKVHVMESMDIAQLRQPKPRTISLEPIAKRVKTKTGINKSRIHTGIKVVDFPNNGGEEGSRRPSAEDPPQSPVLSEVSSVSAVSSSGLSYQNSGVPTSERPGQGSDCQSTATSSPGKTITATTELLRGGCLPGDVLPIVINVDHVKPVKSLQGVIVTLYRLGRIDTHPIMPVGPAMKNKKLKDEDYYPRSRTGLGGLSLSSAGSSHVYRMDLTQSFTPLIIDPQTLTAVVKASVRVPEDAFPTISNVPGAMISFRYYVEVVIDLRGKLASQDRIRPLFSMTDAPNKVNYGSSASRRTQFDNGAAIHGPAIEETDRIRRDRSVVACIFEVVVGTKDTARKRSRQAEGARHEDPHNPTQAQEQIGDVQDAPLDCQEEPMEFDGHVDINEPNCYSDIDDVHIISPESVGSYPLPDSEEPLDEKARLRRAEAQLLPSVPPLEEEASSSYPASTQPSAPTPTMTYRGYGLEDQHAAYGGPSTLSSDRHTHDERQIPGEEITDSTTVEKSTAVYHDKEELERQRLLAVASAPDDVPYHVNDEYNVEQQTPPASGPSAPYLSEHDEYAPHESRDRFLASVSSHTNYDHTNLGEILPEYQK